VNKRSFASDNNAGVHPQVMDALQKCNVGHVIGYGDDPYTQRTIELFKHHFGKQTGVYFVYGGTGANRLCFVPRPLTSTWTNVERRKNSPVVS